MKQAEILKRIKYKFGFFLNKGDIVFIQEETINNHTYYRVARKQDSTVWLSVQKKEFRFI